MPKSKIQAFTLIEALITIAISLVLTTLAYPCYSDFVDTIQKKKDQVTKVAARNRALTHAISVR